MVFKKIQNHIEINWNTVHVCKILQHLRCSLSVCHLFTSDAPQFLTSEITWTLKWPPKWCPKFYWPKNGCQLPNFRPNHFSHFLHLWGPLGGPNPGAPERRRHSTPPRRWWGPTRLAFERLGRRWAWRRFWSNMKVMKLVMKSYDVIWILSHMKLKHDWTIWNMIEPYLNLNHPYTWWCLSCQLNCRQWWKSPQVPDKHLRKIYKHILRSFSALLPELWCKLQLSSSQLLSPWRQHSGCATSSPAQHVR